MARLKLFYFGPNKGKVNFGDELSPILLREVTGREVVYSSILSCDIIALGSNLDTFFRWLPLRRALNAIGANRLPVTLWGGGFIQDGPPRNPKALDVLAVRGPQTRDRLGLGPETPLGDPGLLAGELSTRRGPKTHAWGIVPHLVDIDDPLVRRLVDATPNACLIRLDGPPLEVLDQMAGCERIASTSLHGLITADSLGIPNAWIELGSRLKGGRWKFSDYYASVGRGAAVPAVLPVDGNLDHLAPDLATDHFARVPDLCRGLRAAIAKLG